MTDEYVCRVCHDPVDPNTDRDGLVSPCRCTGSMAFIHLECFNRMARNRCEICQFRYIANNVPFSSGQRINQILGLNIIDVEHLETILLHLPDGTEVQLREFLMTCYQIIMENPGDIIKFLIIFWYLLLWEMIRSNWISLIRLISYLLAINLISLSSLLLTPIFWLIRTFRNINYNSLLDWLATGRH